VIVLGRLVVMLLSAWSDHCILTFSYLFLLFFFFRPPPLVDRFISYKDVNCVDVDFLSYQQVGRLDWGALYDTPDFDLQVSLLTDFVNHLYRVCVPVRWKFVFVSDPRYPWMTLG
jgi:hypothetical protein